MKIKDWLKSNNLKIILILIGLGLFLPSLTFADDPVAELIGTVIFKVFMMPFVLALQIEMWIIPVIARYNGFTTDLGIVQGWAVLRDLANMFFILILLVISFATILGVKSYGYKQLLSRLIIVAILINFSRTIVGLVIDISQVVMLTFLQAIVDVLHGGIFVALGLAKIVNMSQSGIGDLGTVVMALILGGIMLAITVIVMGVFLVILVMRVVKIWIAVVLSPLAFLAYVLPKTQSYANKWASELGKELTAGPVLLFFLWLALTIVGRGDVNDKFLETPDDAQAPIQQVSEATDPKNLINYAIGIALLIGGLQATAASGAAGASLAGAAASNINSFASRKARGLAGRTAAGLGRLVAYGEGEKAGQIRGGRLGTWIRRAPMYGGLIQRTAIKAQGWDAQRRAKDREESLKYVMDQHKVAYTGSMSPSYYRPKDWKQDKDGKYYKVNGEGKYIDKAGNIIQDQTDVSQRVGQNLLQRTWPTIYGVGRAIKRAGSLGESEEHELAEALVKEERGEINSDNAGWANRVLRKGGIYQDKVDKINKNFVQYADEEEVNRAIERYGMDYVMGDIRGESLVDPKTGKATKSAKIWAKAILKHAKSDPNTMMRLALKNDKFDRWTMAEVFRDVDVDEYYDMDKHTRYETDEHGNAVVDKKGIITESYGNAANVRDLFLEKLYPNMLADRVGPDGQLIAGLDRRHIATIDPSKIRFKAGTVGDTITQRRFERLDQYKERSSEITGLDLAEWDDEKGQIKADTITTDTLSRVSTKFKTREDFESWRQQKYRELKFLTQPTDDDLKPLPLDDKRRLHDNSHLSNAEYAIKYTPPQGDRHDLSFMGATHAKENEEIFAARMLKFSGVEEDPEYVARIRRIESKLDKIDRLVKPEGMTDDVWQRMQARRKAEVVGDNRAVYNLISDTFYVEGQDGGDGSRAAEINLSDEHEARIFKHVMHAFEKGQQGSFLNVATSRQLATGLDVLTKAGKLPTKVLAENTPKDLAAEAMQNLRDVENIMLGNVTANLKTMGPGYWDWQATADAFRRAAEQGFKDAAPIVKQALDSRVESVHKANRDAIEQREGAKKKKEKGSDKKEEEAAPKPPLSMEGLQAAVAEEEKKKTGKR